MSKMILVEYYKLKPKAIYPQTELIDEILISLEKEFGEGCVCRRSVMNWLTGANKPDKKYWAVLSKVTGIKEENLF